MPWWGWVLVCVGLLVFAAAVIGLLCLRLWRKGKALLAELSRAGREVSEVSLAMAQLSERGAEVSAHEHEFLGL